MNNKELMLAILEEAEKNHLNLYHDASKEEIMKKVNSIRNINELSDQKFDLEMLKIFAMFKDAHTSYYTPYKFLSHEIIFHDGKFYLDNDGVFKEIKSFNGVSSKDLVKELEPLQNYETIEWLNKKINTSVNNGYYFEMLDILKDGKIDLKLLGDTIATVEEIEKPKEIDDKEKSPYNYNFIGNKILYLRYSACIDDPGKPFVNVVKEIEKELNEKKIRKYILDLRGNTGGNSEILNPFQDLVARKNLQGVLLIDNGVFSSGRFAVSRFKSKFKTTLIGEPTGGAAKSYGYVKNLKVENKKFSVSIRLWDFSNIYGYEGAIQPDIFVKPTIEDIQNKNDVVLKKAIEEVLKLKKAKEK